MGKNYLVASGNWDLLKMGGEINGTIQLGDLNNLFSFSWKGDLTSGKGEIIPRGTRLKGSITFDSSGNISGELKANLLKGKVKMKITGKDWKWKIYGKGENLEEFIKLVELQVNNDLSFRGNLVLGYYGNTFTLEVSGLYKDEKIEGEFSYDKNKLGNIVFNIDSQGVDIRGNILEGKIWGRFDFYNRGRLSFSEINIKSILKDFEGRIDGDIFLEETPKFNIKSKEISYGNIKFKDLDIKGRIQDGIYLDLISLSLFDNIKISAMAHIKDTIEITGNILGNEFFGNYSSNILRLYGKDFKFYNQDFPFLKDLKGSLDQWSVDFSFDGIKFNLFSSYLEYQGIPIKDLVLKGNYKDMLNLNLRGSSYGISWEINGNVREKFDFDLSLNPLSDFNLVPVQYGYLIESKWRGGLEFGEEIRVVLNLMKTKIPKLINGKIEGNIKEKDWNLKGDFGFANNGNLRLTLDSHGKGKLEGRSLPLSILKDLNIADISGEVSMDFNLKDYSIEVGNLNLSNLSIPFLNRKIGGNLSITRDKEDYEIKGEIANLSKNKGLVTGKFNFNKFNFDITLPDSEFLYSYIPKDFIRDIDKGKIDLNISGDLKQWVINGILAFPFPINIPYIFDKISSIDFKLKNHENEILIESLNVKSFSSKIVGFGEIYPNLNLNLKLNNLVLNFPGLFQGYSEWEITLKDIQEPLIEGKILIYNASISYPQGGEINKGLNKLPKIKLSLDLNLGENVIFYIPNTLNLGLKGSLKISGDSSKPLLNGKIDFSKGNIQVLNRNFSVDFGYIKFPGLSFEENIWEISGSTIIQNYLVFLKAYGFMGQSSVYLKSNPPLSLREILFLLLGQEKLTLAKEETLPLYSLLQEIPIGFQNFLSGILTEYLLNPLLSEISRILNLESIKVQYNLESFVPTWSKIILEKKLREDIIMKIDYSLEKGGLMNLEFEYLLKSGLTLKWLTSGEGNYFFSFEYGVKF